MRFLLRVTSLIGVFFAAVLALGSCGLFAGKGDVYISADGVFGDYDTQCSLYFVSYVEPGANAYDGENIFSESTGTTSANGRTWKIYSIPEGIWDVYFEYTADNDTRNSRTRVNLDANEWAAIWVESSDAVQTDSYQSSGAFSIPNI